MNGAGPCVECASNDTDLYRGDDGRFRKGCDACGHTGGPYRSTQRWKKERPETEQSGLFDF